jgi:hypothetical protein
MHAVVCAFLVAAAIAWAEPAFAQLDHITNREAVAGLKAALEKGSQAAVAVLGRTDGFLGNPQVKIPLPDSLARTERLARRLGFGNEADELVVAMNRAAEAAVPEARNLLLDAVKMSVKDAKRSSRAATPQRPSISAAPWTRLHQRFLPIVKRRKGRVAQRYKVRGAGGRPDS